MYIADKYWNHYIGDTDDSLTLLECKVNGSVNLHELAGYDLQAQAPNLRITAAPEEHKLIDEVLRDFASNPLEYDLSEMCEEEDMLEMAEVCEALRSELYG